MRTSGNCSRPDTTTGSRRMTKSGREKHICQRQRNPVGREAYGDKYKQYGHAMTERQLRSDYGDLVSGGYYKDGAKAPSFYDIKRGVAKMDDAKKALKATSERTAEKKFAEVRSKMLKTTVEKGIDLNKAKVQGVSGDGFLISDGKVTLHARYIMAWGEYKRPHFRFIITDRKG